MGVDLGGTTLTADGTNDLVINNGSVDCAVFENVSGNTIYKSPSHCYFIAGTTGLSASWTTLGSGTTTKMTFNTATQPTGAGFDTANSRFICPLEGYYMMWASLFRYKAGVTSSHYSYPYFVVNGSSGGRRPYGNTPYRMRGFGLIAGSSWSYDNSMSETMYLYVGDIVEIHTYTSGNEPVYQPYSYFAGWYLG